MQRKLVGWLTSYLETGQVSADRFILSCRWINTVAKDRAFKVALLFISKALTFATSYQWFYGIHKVRTAFAMYIAVIKWIRKVTVEFADKSISYSIPWPTIWRFSKKLSQLPISERETVVSFACASLLFSWPIGHFGGDSCPDFGLLFCIWNRQYMHKKLRASTCFPNTCPLIANFRPMGQNGCFSERKPPIRLSIGHFGC